jgi:hypothetical protein
MKDPKLRTQRFADGVLCGVSGPLLVGHIPQMVFVGDAYTSTACDNRVGLSSHLRAACYSYRTEENAHDRVSFIHSISTV